MPKKVEIEFDVSFVDDKVIPKPLGRLVFGPYVARLALCPDGNLRMTIPKQAIDQGFVVTYDQDEIVRRCGEGA